jgi:squalene-hopene/tetraprenyl-beta-curcumene cyclase
MGDPDNAQNGLFYYYMTLARSLRAYGQPIITDPQGNAHDWRLELIAKLAELQQPDGSWSGDKRWMENNPILVTAYALIALENARQDLQDHPAR